MFQKEKKLIQHLKNKCLIRFVKKKTDFQKMNTVFGKKRFITGFETKTTLHRKKKSSFEKNNGLIQDFERAF